jgi:hypothetical protein
LPLKKGTLIPCRASEAAEEGKFKSRHLEKPALRGFTGCEKAPDSRVVLPSERFLAFAARLKPRRFQSG